MRRTQFFEEPEGFFELLRVEEPMALLLLAFLMKVSDSSDWKLETRTSHENAERSLDLKKEKK